ILLPPLVGCLCLPGSLPPLPLSGRRTIEISRSRSSSSWSCSLLNFSAGGEEVINPACISGKLRRLKKHSSKTSLSLPLVLFSLFPVCFFFSFFFCSFSLFFFFL
ncbi:uncharacterized protein BO66DRAFT_418296, partial [Aspergillus aculeatinus CBS 121060]